MKKFFLLTIAMISLFYYSEQARSASILEPYAGALFNSTYENDGVKGDVSGSTVGARLGFSQMGFMAGLDGRKNFSTLEPTTGSKSEYTFNQLGFFVGYEAPVMVRFWGEYIFSLEGINNEDQNIKLKKGTGTLFGVGYSILSFISVNLELSTGKTTELANELGTTEYETSFSAYTVSISLPLHL